MPLKPLDVVVEPELVPLGDVKKGGRRKQQSKRRSNQSKNRKSRRR
jgi:hypothetical protein